MNPTPSRQVASAAATPKTTTIERIATAIADNITPELHDQIAFGYCAKAALQALRQVDEGTVEAGQRTQCPHGEENCGAEVAFIAMIDHILSQGGEPWTR